jgi:hypothetical protein
MESRQPIEITANLGFSLSNHIVRNGEQPDPNYINKSAIDNNNNSSDWETLVEDSGRNVVDKFSFQRVKPNLTPCKSLITLILTQGCTQSLSNSASQSTSTLPHTHAILNSPVVNSSNNSDQALIIKRGIRAPPIRPTNVVPRLSAQLINITTTGMNYKATLSLRITRYNILAAKLINSLRHQLL